MLLAPAVMHQMPACAGGQLWVSLGVRISPETGERGDVFRIRNASSRTCTLAGYPGVSFGSGRRVFPFRIVRGGSDYAVGLAARTLTVRPGRSVFSRVAKYRCDKGGTDVASARIYPPNTYTQFRVRLHDDEGAIEYCHGGPSAPGNTIYVSPVVHEHYPYAGR